jgi:hypothetical protein
MSSYWPGRDRLDKSCISLFNDLDFIREGFTVSALESSSCQVALGGLDVDKMRAHILGCIDAIGHRQEKCKIETKLQKAKK